jgi:hypothetical protein
VYKWSIVGISVAVTTAFLVCACCVNRRRTPAAEDVNYQHVSGISRTLAPTAKRWTQNV